MNEKTIGQMPVSPEQIYRALLRMSPASVSVSSLENGTLYDVSDRFCQQSGFSREEIIGKTALELGLWSDPQQDRQKFIEILFRDGLCRNMEVKHRKKDGAILTCLDSGALITIGNERYMLTLVMDITARKQAEEALLSERDFSRAVMDSLPGLFYVIDERERFLLWNNNVMDITGFSEEEFRSMPAMEFILESDRSLIFEKMKSVFRTGETSVEAGLVCKDGTVTTFLFSGTRIQYKGRPCLLGTGIDITDKKKATNELKLFAESLEEANIAMRVLMNRKDEDRKDMEEKLQSNVNNLVVPYLKMLKQAGLDDRYKKYLNILENNLREVLSPFIGNMLSSYKSLTPHEIQIADLIRRGKGTKEIADMINASVNTVATHRNNIRKKLKLKNVKINLRPYLQSLS